VISFVATTHRTSPGAQQEPTHEGASLFSYLLHVLTVAARDRAVVVLGDRAHGEKSRGDVSYSVAVP
jgi:hypothetical protein